MAEEVQIAGSNARGKIRNPLGVIGLSIITLGIYGWVWYYKVNKELAEIGRARNTEECGTSPGTSLLAVTLGALVIVPVFVSAYRFCKRLSAAERLTGVQSGMDPGLLFVLYVFISPVALYIAQANLNKVLEQQAKAGDGQLPPIRPEVPVQETPAEPVAAQPPAPEQPLQAPPPAQPPPPAQAPPPQPPPGGPEASPEQGPGQSQQ